MQSEELSPEELSSLLSSYMPEIPGYRVIRRIGKGGMSYVYLGVQVSLDRQVAIKVMSPEALTDEKSKQRFEQEAHTIAKLEHPCIVGVHEVGRTPQGLLYYVLPYLARGHLGQRDFTHDEARVVEVLRALLSALEYAHARGIVHRDVKAENVLFDNADRPLLTDFGIALTRTDNNRITTAGLAIGSGGYMAPEQARGESVDGRADLYSVGVLAYELLNGRLPYLCSDPLGLALMHAQDPIPRLPVDRKHWQMLIDRSMAKSPDNRFRNAQQMLGVLNQIAMRDRSAVPEQPPSILLPAAPAPVRPWLRPALFALAGSAVLAMIAVIFWPSGNKESPPSDFFTAKQSVAIEPAPPSTRESTTAPAVVPREPTLIAAPVLPTPILPKAGSAAPTAATPEKISSLPAFADVSSSVTVTALDFDPTVPGVRDLRAAATQIKQNRLSTPAGDNALESLLAARKAGAAIEETAKLSDELIDGFGKALFIALKANRDEVAKTSYRRAQKFATDSERLKGDAWKELRKGLPAIFVVRLNKSLATADNAALARSKALARTLEVDPLTLEPAWSREIPPPKPNTVSRSAGPAVVLVVPSAVGRPGIAFMRQEVSRADYAQFASTTGRAAAPCRNRLALITMKRRDWVAPGFPQTGDHPAVCVSFEDASSYAQWVSQRTGETYRLPSSAEWRLVAGYKGSGNPCQDGRVECGQVGTVPVSQGPTSPMGMNGVRGNVREWISDCAGGCRRRLVGGLGWRDTANRADPMRTSGFDAASGFDDVGFRLVRDVPAP